MMAETFQRTQLFKEVDAETKHSTNHEGEIVLTVDYSLHRAAFTAASKQSLPNQIFLSICR
jgi:uncharacterized protein YkuJ